MTEEKILDRVRKMLALANDTRASEGERDNALRMAHNLLAKHNLSLADVEAAARNASDPRGEHTEVGWAQPWARTIYDAMAHLFFCRYAYGGKVNSTKLRHKMIGRASNATTALLMADYLCTSILRECRQQYVHNLSPESRQFATGAAHRIYWRVQQMIKDQAAQRAEHPMSNGRALALADIYKLESEANALAVAELWPALVKGKPAPDVPLTKAYFAGQEYGATAALNVQVGKKQDNKQLEGK